MAQLGGRQYDNFETSQGLFLIKCLSTQIHEENVLRSSRLKKGFHTNYITKNCNKYGMIYKIIVLNKIIVFDKKSKNRRS